MKDYKQRLGVGDLPGQSITILRSTVMDSWISEAKGRPFIDILEEEFRQAISEALLQDSIRQVFHNIDSNKDGKI